MIGSGTVFGPYRVIEKIGAGGMGEVYRALDPRLEREVALKIISDSFLVSDPSTAPRPRALRAPAPNSPMSAFCARPGQPPP